MKTYPLLSAHLATGRVRVESLGYGRYDYVGRAADDEYVSLGFPAEKAEEYLQTHPTPDTW